MKAVDFITQIRNGDIDVVEHTRKVIEQIKKINKEYHYFNAVSEKEALEQAEKVAKNPSGKLAGLPVSFKDAICVKGVETTAGSRILKGYRPTFDATVVERVKKEGGIVIGKTSQDEFGFGAFSVNMGIGYEKPLNPFDKERACGGSSGGSGGISQKADFPHISLGESTGGSIVNPASFCGVFGLCPTYGRVSRYGLLDYSNSLDKIGPMAKYADDIALMMEVIAGFDENESTCADKPVDDYTKQIDIDISGMKIGVIKEAFNGADAGVEKAVRGKIAELEGLGAEYEEISLPTAIKFGIPTYYLISTSEASTNLAKYCGMRYGKHEKLEEGFNEYFTKVRSMHLGQEAKRRIILGTFARMAGYRDAYYMKAMAVRTKIIQEYKKAFKEFDALVCPTVSMLPPKFTDIDKLSVLDHYNIDNLTVGPNLAGLPHMNVPVGFEGKLPVGMMLIANHFDENSLIRIGSDLVK
ncbi:Asp-tRNA(Asn)/Glu-tRNA(Gln) amidotransferase subunit GatA [Candidatus Woesearchaeota archaeon]|nr:Asp-tRNA(Asn)/Glu-tRNA(Gln) amidotransferase subunit GatA [Candidatus Woesearchaeota archaeon]